jgi:predicted nucleic acid-binding protein
MRIILDTSVLVREGYLRSGRMRALLKAAHFMEFKVLMPDVVWDELSRKSRKRDCQESRGIREGRERLECDHRENNRIG